MIEPESINYFIPAGDSVSITDNDIKRYENFCFKTSIMIGDLEQRNISANIKLVWRWID